MGKKAPRPDREETSINEPVFDPNAVADELASGTEEVLRRVEALSGNRGPSDETLRTLICI